MLRKEAPAARVRGWWRSAVGGEVAVGAGEREGGEVAEEILPFSLWGDFLILFQGLLGLWKISYKNNYTNGLEISRQIH
jgi:hypothetical protein